MRTEAWTTETTTRRGRRAIHPAALPVMLMVGLLAGFALRTAASAGGGRAAATAAAPGPAGAPVPASAPVPTSGPASGSAPVPLTPPAAGEGYATVAHAVMPSVVNISSLQVIKTYERFSPFMADPFFQQFFGGGGYDYIVPRERRQMSLGSGVIADPKGIILTNNHVVENATEVKVALADGRELQAKVIGVDTRTDLAALKVDQAGLPSAVLGDSDRLQVGDIVLAFGNPFGLGGTVTMGIVSAIGRGNLGLADYEDFIQTDAAINPGNSGGALVNTRGEVVGINTAILSESGGYQGVGFAIPANMAREVLDSLMKNGRVIRGYAGVAVQRVTPDLARAFGLSDTHGAVVSSLDPEGPASEAGLRRGDLIVSFKGRPVATDDELRTQMSRLKPGDRTTLGVLRGGRRLDVDLVLSEPPQEQHPHRRG
jgi:Do/DeqQ family serine protease